MLGLIKLMDGNYIDADLIGSMTIIGDGRGQNHYLRIEIGRDLRPVNFPFTSRDQAETERERIAGLVAQCHGVRREMDRLDRDRVGASLFDNLEGLQFPEKLDRIASRAELSRDPFIRWVGDRLFRVASQRASYLGAKSPEDYDDRHEAAIESDLQEAVKWRRIRDSSGQGA